MAPDMDHCMSNDADAVAVQNQLSPQVCAGSGVSGLGVLIQFGLFVVDESDHTQK